MIINNQRFDFFLFFSFSFFPPSLILLLAPVAAVRVMAGKQSARPGTSQFQSLQIRDPVSNKFWSSLETTI